MTEHQVRLSIDLHSIIKAQFRGQLQVGYQPLPLLGIDRPFKTTPPLGLSSPLEHPLPNSFSGYMTTAT